MKIVLVSALVLWSAVALATPATHTHGSGSEISSGWDPAGDEIWVQLPECSSTAISSMYDYVYPLYSECADDFRCWEGTPIVGIEWWGRYW